MSNALLCWPNRAYEVTLSGGSWQSSSLDRIKTRHVADAAITTDTALASTKFTARFSKERFIRVISLYGHNLTFQAKVRITLKGLNGDVKYVTGAATSGNWIDAWPAIYLPSQLEWEDDNWWSGRVNADQLEGLPRSLVLVLPKSYFAYDLVVEVSDLANPDGVIRIGRLIACPQWQPAINISYGAALGWEDPSEVATSLSGAEYFNKKQKYRVAIVRLDFLSEEDGTNMAMGMTGQQGITEEVFFVFDPDNPLLTQQRSFNARLRSLSPLEYPAYSITGMGFELKEVL